MKTAPPRMVRSVRGRTARGDMWTSSTASSSARQNDRGRSTHATRWLRSLRRPRADRRVIIPGRGSRPWVRSTGQIYEQRSRMARVVVLYVAAMAAMVLAQACGSAPQRVEVGELRTESRSADVEGADSVKANLRLAIGELDVGGGATGSRLMEADFAYNVAAWGPSVDYGVVGDSGELEVRQQGLTEGIPTQDVRNEWGVRLSEDVPVDLMVQMGGGVGNLDLDNLALTGMNLNVGAGSTRVDLSGEWKRDLSAIVRGGAGQLTVLLPSRMGVKVNAGTRLGRVNAEGLQKEGKSFVNDAYNDSDATLRVEVTGGAGQINLEVVQQQGDSQQVGTGGTTMMQDSTITIMQPGGNTIGQ